MKERRFTMRMPFALLLLSAGILLPRPAGSVLGDDLFLLTTSVPPNVVLFLDNSASMNQIEWHPNFPIDTPSATCTDFDDDTTYDTSQLANSETHCGNTRDIFAPENPTLWDGRYLNWYFSDAADPYVSEIENAIAVTAGCNQAGSQTRFVQKYRRTRADAAKQVLLDVLCLAEPRGIRFGLAGFRSAEDVDDEDPNGGYLSVPIDDNTPAHAADLEAHVGNTKDDVYGPLGEAFFQIYTYLMSRTEANRPTSDQDGDSTATRFPNYGYDEQGEVPNNAAQIVADPMQYSCQKAFVVMVTDGGPTRDDFDSDPDDTAAGFDDFADLVGDYNADGETEETGADEAAWYLDDIAKYAQDNDFRPDMTDDQKVDTYTVGFATDAATTAFLQKTADVANGLSFHAKDGEQLAEALVAALNDIIEKSHSFTAATVPSARTADGGDFYNSFFLPSAKTAFWEGHLRAWHIDAIGDVRDKFGNCALEDPTAGECNSGRFKPRCEPGVTTNCVTPYWDAADEVPAPFSRNLKVSKLVSGSPAMVSFDQTLGAADLDIPVFTAPPDPAPNSVLYGLNGSTAINEEGLADEVIAHVRGCFLGSGTDDASVSPNVLTPKPCEVRPWTLGDIFHSDPLVISKPRKNFNLGASHNEFRNGYINRKRVIYAGTNAGFLHAFHAGEWDVSLDPDDYNEGTGAELFGFMPWRARKNVKKLPIDFPTSRTHYVDGSAQSADVWFYSDPEVADKLANGSEWRTLLMGGLRQGGKHYYALDVTNPSGTEYPTGRTLPYPAYLWEFPAENDPENDLGYMGQTWGQPVLTRVRVKVGNNAGADGKGFERWVAIVTGGYDPTGDPNPVEVTGAASSPYVNTATAGRSIFILDVQTGKVLAERKFKPTGSVCPNGDGGSPEKNMCFAMPTSPSVLDLDFDGFADVIYVGDLGGNVWKWVIAPMGEDRANDNSSLRTQPAWPFRRIFKAPIEQISGTDYYKNFYFPPAASYISGKLWLAFGSGERGSVAYAGDSSAGSDESNRFYVVSDLDPYERASPALPTVLETNLQDISGNQGGAVITGRGFYFKAADGEKFVTRSEVFTGLVIVSSFKPVNTGDRCTSRGDATLYIFDLGTGEGYFKDGSNNPIRATSIGTGFPTDPKVSVGVGGEDTRVFIEKSGADLESLEAPDVPAGGSYLYWRERN
jgi:type IV pilus assembly protein PilY1